MTSGSSGQHASQHADGTPVAGDWSALSDELIQGLVHALNNRVAALGAFVELARLGDEEADPLTVLPEEIAQLHRVNGLFALLPARGGEPEALELPLVLDDALRLFEHHPRLRADQSPIVREGTLLPVRTIRWALLRVLLMLVHAGRRSTESVHGHGGATIRLVGDEEYVSVRVATRAEPSAQLATLAERCGGECARDGDDLVLRLPSILELRRRERASRESAGS